MPGAKRAPRAAVTRTGQYKAHSCTRLYSASNCFSDHNVASLPDDTRCNAIKYAWRHYSSSSSSSVASGTVKWYTAAILIGEASFTSCFLRSFLLSFIHSLPPSYLHTSPPSFINSFIPSFVLSFFLLPSSIPSVLH